MLFAYGFFCTGLSMLAGCAGMRCNAPSPDLRPCNRRLRIPEMEWRLAFATYRPPHPIREAAGVLCHGLGLNATSGTDHRTTIFPVSWPARDTSLPSSTSGPVQCQRWGDATRSIKPFAGTFLRDRGESKLDRRRPGQVRRAGRAHYIQRRPDADASTGSATAWGMLVFNLPDLAPHPERIANSRDGKHDHSGGNPTDRMLGPTKGSGLIAGRSPGGSAASGVCPGTLAWK